MQSGLPYGTHGLSLRHNEQVHRQKEQRYVTTLIHSNIDSCVCVGGMGRGRCSVGTPNCNDGFVVKSIFLLVWFSPKIECLSFIMNP